MAAEKGSHNSGLRSKASLRCASAWGELRVAK